MSTHMLFLTPDPASQRNGSKLSSVSFDLRGLHAHDYTLSRRGFLRVAQARFMHSWANVGAGNNTISAGGIIVSVPVGVYSATSLLTAILTAATGPLTGLRFNSSTGMYGGVAGVSGSLGGIMGFGGGVFSSPANLIFHGQHQPQSDQHHHLQLQKPRQQPEHPRERRRKICSVRELGIVYDR
jgi:hypothetical protein